MTTTETDLGEVARQGLEDVEDQGGPQGMFKDMDYTKVKFVGVQYDTLELPLKIGDEVVFLVQGRVTAVGDEAMKDGHIRHVAKVEVQSVTPHEEG